MTDNLYATRLRQKFKETVHTLSILQSSVFPVLPNFWKMLTTVLDSILHSPEQTPLSRHPGRWNVLPHPLTLGSAWSWIVSSLDRSKGLRTCCVWPSCSLSGEKLTQLARGGSDTHGADQDQPAAWSWAQPEPVKSQWLTDTSAEEACCYTPLRFCSDCVQMLRT